MALIGLTASLPQQRFELEPEELSYFELGQYYFNQGDSPDGAYDLIKARDNFQKAIAEDPDGNSVVWHQLGRINFLEGRFDDAIYSFKKQLQYFGDEVPNVYYMLGLTYGFMARGSQDEELWRLAAENFLKYLEYDPQSPWAKVDLAWVYFAQDRYEEMLPLLETGLFDHPDNPWLLNMYGLALMNTGENKIAHEQFTRALEQAEALTAEDWGLSYPGNDPKLWPVGLAEFRKAIAKNKDLTANKLR